MKVTTRILSTATTLLLLAGTAACGGSDSSTTSSGATTLGVKNTTITVAAAGATPVPGTDGQALSAGETLTTDGTGFGIVNYPDKSLTRLDKNAVFTLDTVGTSATQPQVKATLKQGQAWNRVQKITGTDGQYEITTPYGTVAVRGTTFNIDCTQPPGACTITAIDGVLAITPTNGTATTLTAPAQTVLNATAVSPPAPIPAAFTASAWATTNTALDAATAAQPAAASTPTSAPTAASPVAVTFARWSSPSGSFTCPMTAKEVTKSLGAPTTASEVLPRSCYFDPAGGDITTTGLHASAFHNDLNIDAYRSKCAPSAEEATLALTFSIEERPDLGPGAFACAAIGKVGDSSLGYSYYSPAWPDGNGHTDSIRVSSLENPTAVATAALRPKADSLAAITRQ